MAFLLHSTDQRERSVVRAQYASQCRHSTLKYAAACTPGNVNFWVRALQALQCIPVRVLPVWRLLVKCSSLKRCAIWWLARDWLLRTGAHMYLKVCQTSGDYFERWSNELVVTRRFQTHPGSNRARSGQNWMPGSHALRRSKRTSAERIVMSA